MVSQEHTWFEYDSFYPMRPPLTEAKEKRTYYLTRVEQLTAGVTRMEHSNREGERIDIVWDAREKRGTSGRSATAS